MRDFKKHFFETLIQLTILANVFRQNNHPFSTTSPEGDHQQYPLFFPNLTQQSFQSQYTEPDLLFLQDIFNVSTCIDNLNQENYRVKEVRSYFNELNLINRQNQQLSRALPFQRQESQLPNIVLQPASAIYPSNNHKRIIDLSETRILLNSLELNANNNNSLRKEFEMDIELQMLIEQDIDQGIKNSLFYEQTSDPTRNQQQLNSNDLCKVKNNVYPFEENQKHQDILTAMKLHETQLLSERYKLFVEEDTGEIVYQINDHFTNNNNNNNSPPQQVSSPLINNGEVSTNSNYTLTKPVKEIAPIDLAMKHKPNDERIVYSKPNFLSQTSVCKELNKLDGGNGPTSSDQAMVMLQQQPVINSNTNVAACGGTTTLTASGPFPVLDQQMLNEYIEENLITNAPKTSFDIQQDLETASFLPNATDSLIPDVFEFDENFLKRFESNLTEIDLGENSRNSSIMTQSTNNIFLDQTVLSTSASDNSSHPQQSNNALYRNDSQNIDNQFYQQTVLPSNQTRSEGDPSLNFLTDQLDMSLTDIFRTYNGSPMTGSLLNNFTQFNNVSNNNNNNNTIKPDSIVQPLPLNTSFIKTEQMYPTNIHNENNSIQGVEPGSFATNQIKHEFIRDNEKHQSKLISNNSSTSQQQQLRQLHQLQVPQQSQQPQNQGQQQGQSQLYSAVEASEETLATIRGLNHNHTYMDGAKTEEDSEVYHPYSYKNKLKKMLKNLKNTDVNNTRQQESRDQLLLQTSNINLSISHIVESSADEFNEIIKSVRLNAEQLSVVKDIRRRGKNKVAAQICRKRKIDSIDSLKEDVEQMMEMKSILDQEQDFLEKEINDLTIKFESLYQDLMGSEYDMNDPIIVYMNNLKAQLNLNLKLKQFNSKNNKSMGSETTESENSTEYGSANSSLRSQISDYDEESNNSNINNYQHQRQHAEKNKAEKSDESNLISSKNKKLKN